MTSGGGGQEVPPAWYPDPHGAGLRWWDGQAWTEHLSAPALPGPEPTMSSRLVPQQAGYPYPMQVAPKNPGISLLASFFIPGLGSMINGDAGKGVGILLGYVVAVFFSFILIGLPFLIGFWVWGMVDGYQGARTWNLRHGILS